MQASQKHLLVQQCGQFFGYYCKYTLNKLRKLNVNNKIKKYGKSIKTGWIKLAKKNKIRLLFQA